MRRIGPLIWIAALWLPALVFGGAWYVYYWRQRSCFNEEGRCFDGVVVAQLETAEMILALFVASMALAGVVTALAIRRTRSR